MISAQELPDGWQVARLSDPSVAQLNPKKSEVRHLDDATAVTFVPMSAVDDESGTITRPESRKLGSMRKGYTYFAEGDVIFAKITPCMENGKCATTRGLLNNIGFGSTEFHVVRAGTKTMPEWLHLILRSKQVREDAENAMQGAAGQQRVPVDFLKQLEIPVPPLTEQSRLVARIEALTSRLEQARQARQAALAEAEEVFQRALEIEFSDDTTENWSEHTADELFEIVSGQVSPLNPKFHDLPYLGPEHVESGTSRIIGERVSVAELKMKSGKYRFTPEHVIYSKIRPALRKVCTPDYHGLCSADMYALRPNADLITREFLKFLLLAPAFSNYAMEKSDRNAMPKINQTTLRAYRFRIPAPPEQARIVGLLSSILAKQSELRRLQTETEAELAAFTPALLAKALRGEL